MKREEFRKFMEQLRGMKEEDAHALLAEKMYEACATPESAMQMMERINEEFLRMSWPAANNNRLDGPVE